MDLLIIAKEGVADRSKQDREAFVVAYQPRGWVIVGPAASPASGDVRTVDEAEQEAAQLAERLAATTGQAPTPYAPPAVSENTDEDKKPRPTKTTNKSKED